MILISRRKEELQRVKNALLNTHHVSIIIILIEAIICEYTIAIETNHFQTVPTYVPVILPLDLTEINLLPTEISKVSKIHGRIDILINNADISYKGEAKETKVDVDIKVMLINYFAQVALTKGYYFYFLKANVQ